MAVVFECDRCQGRFAAADMDKRGDLHKISIDADKAPGPSQYRWILCSGCLAEVEQFINEGSAG